MQNLSLTRPECGCGRCLRMNCSLSDYFISSPFSGTYDTDFPWQ